MLCVQSADESCWQVSVVFSTKLVEVCPRTNRATHSRVVPAPVVTHESMLSIEILPHVEHKGALREGFGYGYLPIWFAGTDCATSLCSSY